MQPASSVVETPRSPFNIEFYFRRSGFPVANPCEGGGGRGNVLTILTGIIHTMLASIKLIRKMCSGKPLVRYIAPNKLETELAQKEHDDNFSLRADKG